VTVGLAHLCNLLSGPVQIDVTSGDGTHTAKYLLTVTRQERSYRLQKYQYLDSADGKGRTWGYVHVCISARVLASASHAPNGLVDVEPRQSLHKPCTCASGGEVQR
jgi:hypothetical protein